VWFDKWKLNVLGDVLDLLGAGEEVHANGVIRGVVWSCTFLLVSVKNEKSELRFCRYSFEDIIKKIARYKYSSVPYLRKVSLLSLKRDGSTRVQHPGEGFSPPHGIVSPPLGRTTYFFDSPTSKRTTHEGISTSSCAHLRVQKIGVDYFGRLTDFTCIVLAVVLYGRPLVGEANHRGLPLGRADAGELLHLVVEADGVQQLAYARRGVGLLLVCIGFLLGIWHALAGTYRHALAPTCRIITFWM
jgi:hypothetical protein